MNTKNLVEVVRCKDCEYFLKEKVFLIDNIPIMGHLVCEKWGGGCKTSEDGFCYLGKLKEIEKNS